MGHDFSKWGGKAGHSNENKSTNGGKAHYEKNAAEGECSTSIKPLETTSIDTEGAKEKTDFQKEMQNIIQEYKLQAEKDRQGQARILQQGVQRLHHLGILQGQHHVMHQARKAVQQLQPKREMASVNGLCVAVGKEGEDNTELRQIYEEYMFEVRILDSYQNIAEFTEKYISGNTDFIVIHGTSEASTDDQKHVFDSMRKLRTAHENTPLMLLLQVKDVEDHDPDIENALIITTNIPEYTELYLRTLRLHGTTFDLDSLLQITETELKECGHVPDKGMPSLIHSTLEAKMLFKKEDGPESEPEIVAEELNQQAPGPSGESMET